MLSDFDASMFSLLYLFNGISISYGLFNAEIWFICKCLVTTITYIFNIPLQSYFFRSNILLFFSNNHLFAHSYNSKYSYLIQIICTQKWFQVFLSNINDYLFAHSYDSK